MRLHDPVDARGCRRPRRPSARASRRSSRTDRRRRTGSRPTARGRRSPRSARPGSSSELRDDRGRRSGSSVSGWNWRPSFQRPPYRASKSASSSASSSAVSGRTSELRRRSRVPPTSRRPGASPAVSRLLISASSRQMPIVWITSMPRRRRRRPAVRWCCSSPPRRARTGAPDRRRGASRRGGSSPRPRRVMAREPLPVLVEAEIGRAVEGRADQRREHVVARRTSRGTVQPLMVSKSGSSARSRRDRGVALAAVLVGERAWTRSRRPGRCRRPARSDGPVLRGSMGIETTRPRCPAAAARWRGRARASSRRCCRGRDRAAQATGRGIRGREGSRERPEERGAALRVASRSRRSDRSQRGLRAKRYSVDEPRAARGRVAREPSE